MYEWLSMAITIVKNIFADIFLHGIMIFTAARHFRHRLFPRQIDNPTAALMRKLVRSPGRGNETEGGEALPQYHCSAWA
jgi:hypothetical protein